MAQFELNIYGENDEVVKRFETDRVRWGIFVQALELEETLKGANARDMISAINEFVKKIFPSLTDADLNDADVDDVMHTFKQLLAKAKKIGVNSKNAVGAE
jgi:hypothetical protein